MVAETAPEFRGAHRRHLPPSPAAEVLSRPRRPAPRSTTPRRATIAALVFAAVAAVAPAAGATGPGLGGDGAGLAPWPAAAPPRLVLPALAAADAPSLLMPEPVGLEGLGDRVVVVHFFATWCEPCRDELASLSRLARDQADGLAVIAVDVGEVPVRVRRFLDQAPVAFPVLIDADRQAAAAWGVRALPTSFVLGPGLAPRLAVVGPLDWTTPAVGTALDAAAARATAGEAGGISARSQREKGEGAP